MTNDEWRVEVDLDDEEHGFTLAERIQALDLDADAQRRLGGSITITRDGARMFLYATSEDAAREAERVVRELIAGEELSADLALTRWHPVEEAWRDASVPLPANDEEVAAERARHDAAEAAEVAEEGEYDWEVHVDPPAHGDAVELERRLSAEGLPVSRLWKHLSVGVLTEERAEELVERLRGETPEGTEVTIGARELQHPLFVFFGSALDRFRGAG
jgi:hypothetical protein